jgi:hypothetical protein
LLLGTSLSLNCLGDVAQAQGRYEAARDLQTQSLQIGRQIQNVPVVDQALLSLGDLAYTQREYVRARACYEAVLAIPRQGIHPGRARMARALRGLAKLAALKGRASSAVRLLGAAEALREATGARLLRHEQPELEQHLAALRRQLGEPAFMAAWESGRALTWQEATAYALRRTSK